MNVCLPHSANTFYPNSIPFKNIIPVIETKRDGYIWFQEVWTGSKGKKNNAHTGTAKATW